jgi:hypothetical protein
VITKGVVTGRVVIEKVVGTGVVGAFVVVVGAGAGAIVVAVDDKIKEFINVFTFPK